MSAPDTALTRLRALRRRLAPGLSGPIGKMLPPAFGFIAGLRHKAGGLPPSGPIIVAGFHGSVLGIGEAARSLSATLRSAGFEVIDWDVSALFGHERRIQAGDPAAPSPGAGTLIAHMNPPELLQLIALHGGDALKGRRAIGYWAWELEHLPRAWKPAFRHVDEVWAPSRFTAEAVEEVAPRGMTIRVLPHPLAPTDLAPDRARFELPDDAVVVLSAFDLRSTLARKNPLAAIAAFKRATGRTLSKALLVLKTVGADAASPLLAQINAAIGDAPNIRLFNGVLSPEDRDRLVASADIILSLHRSEGFGLWLAEGMLAGKPVVATAWSGNMDFMAPKAAALIPARLVAVDDRQGMYAGGRWAEADLDSAEARLAELIDDAAARRTMGAAAKAHAAKALDPARWAATLNTWLTP
ncbi:glycosyltransferase family 4 protein [Caulobacter segnis]|uniref:glycosyltransferase family 4 protein n=1 Tax=Caulobacter segnis TaxID=88688 RepID=UPI00240FD628|nr:glycosyltransferase family 4 protein [Caulobacter segnis]MDG2521308.1 glycosyltransferase family 4 protein [Caulobacter segnis]